MLLMLWMDISNFTLRNSGPVILFNFFQDFTFAFETEYNFFICYIWGKYQNLLLT